MVQTQYLRSLSAVRLVVLFIIAALPGLVLLSGCGKKPAQTGQDSVLVVMTPHNENIRYEFEEAFKAYHKATYGTDVTVQWRDAGSGSSSILQYLTNVYGRAETSGIDVLFGGGEYPFQQMDKANLLVPLKLSEDTLANIPTTFGGMEMYSPGKTWCGNVLSSFGFLYNKGLIQDLKIQAPTRWEDLASKDFYDLSVLADPTQSGSIAAAFEMIVQSEKDWHDGWKKLLSILSNAKKFTDSSGDAANAPVLGEAVVSVCIDFYGSMRVADAPDKLGYVSPTGQTGFTPDPIAILKNPPHPVLAQRYVNFVLSLKGQALWALPAGHTDGPKRYLLNRTPIRKDFFSTYDKDIPAWITRPYTEGTTLIVDAKLRSTRYGVLSKLVRAAAIDNIKLMKQAKQKLMEKNYPDDLSALFYGLPDNIDTNEDVYAIAAPLEDTAKAEVIMTDWTTFFRERYKQIIEK